MAEIYSFPNNQDEYIGAEEVSRWLHGRTSGVYGGTGNAVVTAVQNTMKVSVAAGIGWITDANGNGIVWWSDSDVELELDPAESTGTKNRIDRIIVEWNTVDYLARPELKVLKGSDTSGTPTPPALTNTGTIRQISLAQVHIGAGATDIDTEDITDERYDPNVCGIVTETVTLDTTDVFLHYEAALAELRSAISQAWSGEISEGAVSMRYTGTIPANGWTGGDPYVQTITLSGIKATDYPMVDLLASSTYATAEEQIDAFGCIYKVVASANNSLTFYATDEPSVDIPIQVRCIRK